MGELEREISFPDGGTIASDLGRKDRDAKTMIALDDQRIRLTVQLDRLHASHAELLAAAKAAVSAVDILREAAGLNFDLAGLRTAITHAEEQAS